MNPFTSAYAQTAILVIAFVAVIAMIVVVKLMLGRRSHLRKSRIMAPERTPRRVENRDTPRVAGFRIRSLSKDERNRFAERWRAVESRFADDPRGSVEDADDLVNHALVARGYPMREFEEKAAMLAVDHREIVENYRVAHLLAKRASRGAASPEAMRCAMQHYRALMESMCESHGFEDAEWNESTSTVRAYKVPS